MGISMTIRLHDLKRLFQLSARLGLLSATLTVALSSCQTSERRATARAERTTSDERYQRHLEQEERRATQDSADLLGGGGL